MLQNISRRTLIGSAALSLAAGAIAPASAAKKTRDDADLIVCGAGMAGLTAALTAASHGLKVIVIEKRLWTGGDGVLSTGHFATFRTPLHKDLPQSLPLSAEDYWRLIERGVIDEPLSKVRDNQMNSPVYYGVAKHNPEVLKSCAMRAADVIAFVREQGAEFFPVNPALPFLLSSRPGSMTKIASTLVTKLRTAGVRLMNRTRVTGLVIEKGAVRGVRFAGKGGTQGTLRARAVLLATGGFINSPELMQRYKRYWSSAKRGFSFEGDLPADHTGDGILMGKAAGAALEDMESVPKFWAGPVKGTPAVSWLMLDGATAYLVRKSGRRFINEKSARYSGCALRLFSLGSEPGYMLFDEETFRGHYHDELEFEKALAEGGLFKADTAEELARKAGVDATGLKETIARINADAAGSGKDSEYGRTDKFFRPLKAPYYLSAAHYPLAFKTEGGLEVNTHMQVLSASTDKPIPGLYAAGAACGSITTRLCDVFASGLIAGESIALGR